MRPGPARIGYSFPFYRRACLCFVETSSLFVENAASDRIMRFLEGRPEESTLRGGLRLAWVPGALALVIFVSALFAGGWVSAWPQEALLLCAYGVLALPSYFFALTFLTAWTEKALHGPAGPFWLKVTLIGVGSWLLTMLWCMGLMSGTWPADSRPPRRVTSTNRTRQLPVPSHL